MNEYNQEARLETWTFLVTRALNFVYSGQHGDRAGRPETSSNSEMNTEQFEQQSSQVLGLSAKIHFTQKFEKYIQDGQLLQLKNDLQEQLCISPPLQFDQDLQQVKLEALILDFIHKIAVINDLFEQSYSFKYQGNASKLVHRPLTDKCYLNLMHSTHLGYGKNPYSPDGTGKTESVKALGACLGRQNPRFQWRRGH